MSQALPLFPDLFWKSLGVGQCLVSALLVMIKDRMILLPLAHQRPLLYYWVHELILKCIATDFLRVLADLKQPLVTVEVCMIQIMHANVAIGDLKWSVRFARGPINGTKVMIIHVISTSSFCSFQLLLPDYVHISCCSPTASASAPALHCVCLWSCSHSIISTMVALHQSSPAPCTSHFHNAHTHTHAHEHTHTHTHTQAHTHTQTHTHPHPHTHTHITT